MNGSAFRSESVPQELPSWVVLIRQQNGFYEVHYDPYSEGFSRIASQSGRYIQILHEMGFRNPEFNFTHENTPT